MRSRRSLVLITADCLRADHCGFLGYDRPTTPFLDSLAAQSWVFTNAIVAGTPTYYSFPSILASRYPLALGRDAIGLSPDEPTLASALKDAGYATAGFSAANPYLSHQFGYDPGFDTFRDFLDGEADAVPRRENANGLRSRANRRLAQLCGRLGLTSVYDELYFQYCQRIAAPPAESMDILRPFPSAEIIVDQARGWLASLPPGPFFLWLHFMDPHSPYYPTQKSMDIMGNGKTTPSRSRYLNAFWNRDDLGISRLKSRRKSILELYDACIRSVDTQVERLVGVLRQFELWDNCILAFTADHGEEFLEHGGRYHAPSKLTEELIRVPLLLRVPGMTARVARSPFSLLHLAPTVLDALGVHAPSDFRGRSHYRQVERREDWDARALTECIGDCKNPLFLENRTGPRLLAVREREHKLVIDFTDGEERLFDLKDDPGECTPLPEDSAVQTRRRLLEIARNHIECSRTQRNSRLRLTALLRDARRIVNNRPAVGEVR
jgi:arylsulfatase A-like enzyme